MKEVGSIMIGLKTTTGMSAVSRVIKSASDTVVGNSTTFTGAEKCVSRCEDNESEWECCVGVGPDWMECVMFRGRERRLVFSVLEEKSTSSKAVTRSNAPESGCVRGPRKKWEIWSENTQDVENERGVNAPTILAFRLSSSIGTSRVPLRA